MSPDEWAPGGVSCSEAMKDLLGHRLERSLSGRRRRQRSFAARCALTQDLTKCHLARRQGAPPAPQPSGPAGRSESHAASPAITCQKRAVMISRVRREEIDRRGCSVRRFADRVHAKTLDAPLLDSTAATSAGPVTLAVRP